MVTSPVAVFVSEINESTAELFELVIVKVTEQAVSLLTSGDVITKAVAST